jgi:hypothetical protein
MRPHPNIFASWKRASPLVVCLLFGGCRSWLANSSPTITFSTIPAAGVPDKTVAIEGRAAHVRPGQQIVLYTKSDGMWWLEPSANRPFTKVQDDSKWENRIPAGSEYAALLADPGYVPPDTLEVLPSPGAGVAAVQVVKGQGPEPATTPTKTLHFSGYDWTVRTAASDRGGTRNSFDPANAWTDDHGALHLRIAKSQDKWSCAEVKLTRSLGYGTYAFVVRDISHLESSAVLTLFTWDDQGTEQNRRELDIEISRWGFQNNENSHYVVQPYYIPANVARFVAPAGVLTHSFNWEPGEVTFSTVVGSRAAPGARLVNKHVFTSGVPSPGGDLVHMNLYLFGAGETPLKNENEVVIEKFEYLP